MPRKYRSCAQRLSASSEFTPALVPTLLFAGCCSAVFGHLVVLPSFFFSKLPDGPFAWANPPRIRHLTGSQASVQVITALNSVPQFGFGIPLKPSKIKQKHILAPYAKSNGRELSDHDSGRLCSPTCRSQISQMLRINSRSSLASSISSSSQRSFSICRRVSLHRKIEYCNRRPYPLSFL